MLNTRLYERKADTRCILENSPNIILVFFNLISSLEGFLSTAINGKINAQTC